MGKFKDKLEQKNLWEWVNKNFTRTPENLPNPKKPHEEMIRITTGERVEMKQIAIEYADDFLKNLKNK